MSIAAAAEPRVSARVLDRFEQVAVSILYVFLVMRVWPDSWTMQNMFSMILLLSEGAIVVFLLLRKPTEDISYRLSDWAIAAIGSFLVLLANTGGTPISTTAGAILLVVGSVIHIGAKLSLNFSFGLVAANRGVKKNGMYRIVRHPMYAGYIITHIGFLLLQPTLWNLAIYLAAWTMLVLRIGAEERMLRRDPAYEAFTREVRYKLVPGIY